MRLPVQLTRENGSWMARCPDVQGLLVVGDTIVPCHPSRDIPTGTLHSILRDLGFTMKDLRKK